MTDVAVTRFQRTIRACGVSGAVLLLAVILIDGATRTGYSPYRHGVSQLTLGDTAWLERGTYVVCGGLVAALGIGLRRRIAGAPGGTWGPWLVMAVGAGLMVAGVFPTDPALGYPPGQAAVVTTSGRLHQVGGSLLFIGLIGGCFVFARYFGHVQRPGWRMYSIATGIAVTLTAMAAGVLYRLATVAGVSDAPVGALELTAFLLGFAWLATIAWRRLPTTPSESSRS